MYNIEKLRSLIAELYGIDCDLSILYGEIDQNYRLSAKDGQEFLVKVSPENTDPSYLQMQIAITDHIIQKVQDIQIPETISTLSGERYIEINPGTGNAFLRIQKWIPGKLMSECNPVSKHTLYSIGSGLGKINSILESFDLPFENSQIKWAPTFLTPENIDIEVFDKDLKAAIETQLSLFKSNASPRLNELRKSWIYQDANDHNLILGLNDTGAFELTGIIDFGDAVYSHTINDLAVAIAYCVMGKKDPLYAACEIVKGYNQEFKLEESELEVLYYLVSARLILSLYYASVNASTIQDNEYLQVSTRPARDLLLKWNNIHPSFAMYAFRNASGYPACPQTNSIVQWLKKTKPQSLFNTDKTEKKIDLGIGSTFLGNAENFIEDELFEKRIHQQLEYDSEYGTGGYLETRPFYTTDSYVKISDEGPQWRTVHLGYDLWTKHGTIIKAPIEGIVHSYNNNEGRRNYGPTIILEHKTDQGVPFYTLYGHLAEASLGGIEKNQKIAKGQEFCAIGNSEENGGWPPHLHFQIMVDLLDNKGDFPGVCYSHEQDIWETLCPDPAFLFSDQHREKKRESTQDILLKRKKYLPPNLSISYRNPLHMERGFKQYLYDQTGRRYLDTVNNVAHVGHEHPEVVKAGKAQMNVLNTNTRYLHENIVTLAEQLSAKFPDPLEVCFFVNSGSEATELALRLAKTYTENKGMVVMDVGYHGNTSGSIEVSSYKFDRKGGKGPMDHIQKVPLPDVYRGIYTDNTAGNKYSEHVKTQVESLANSEHRLSGFICESILSCGGQIVLPNNFLNKSIEYVHNAGGLYIADEVQVGFGRVGSSYWGFELYGDIIPDIVTMGKPFGNGHPLGAVITTAQIAEAFANGMEYFNTFGGNPVSAAIGKKVMDVVEEENLQLNALKMGNYLTDGLKSLQKSFPVIGDVRGKGLFLGFELMEDPEKKIPSKSKASYLTNRMREKGVLMSTDGFDENVIKIKPPLCIEEKDMDLLLQLLEEVLSEDYMKV